MVVGEAQALEEGTVAARPRSPTGSHPGILLSLFELLEGGPDPSSWTGEVVPSGGPTPSARHLDSLWTAGSDEKAPHVGAILRGRPLGDYWPIEPLGRGGQGEVWKAVRVAPRLELVALKVLRGDLANRPERRDRFRREADLGMRLDDPSILSVKAYGEVDGTFYMVMPLIDGVTLAGVIAHRRRRTAGPGPIAGSWWEDLSEAGHVDAMVRVVSRVARALELTHARRIAHRDVKPANILVDRTSDRGVFLGDFGLGVDLDDVTTRGGDGSGTPLYMAPEKLLGRDADEVRCDVYSLGVTLFECLTLVHPFPVPGGIHKSCLPTYLAGLEPPRPRAIRPDLSPLLEAIILKAMERDPARRYSQAAELADDLDAFLAGETRQQPGTSPLGRRFLDLMRSLAPFRNNPFAGLNRSL